ncbi:MAG TPA: PHB depolymerase family esterase [Polyangiaceae bacterium]|nr:PHB depolymerase family esterase [Polyangiaceae bacterium]
MQHRYRSPVVALSSLFLGLFVAAPAGAASLQQVSNWGASGVPSYVQMHIYVPDTVAAKPPIVVSAHSCGSTASGQMGNIPKIKAAADKNGFILILPDNPGQNCWDVGAKDTSLKHDAGGDTKAVVQMVKYALTKYNGDASRVYAMGGSSGAMLTQALMAVYPDVFRAGSARAGVPAGCWAESYDSSMQWSGPCAKGTVMKTAQQWGDLARGMFPSYTGHRPRLQVIQGDNDTTIYFQNLAESIKQWTNVLALSTAPSSTDMTTTSVATYSRQFWKNTCGYVVFETWAGKGGTHSMAYEEDAILKFFGLDVVSDKDPEPECPAGGGSGGGGAGGGSGAGGTNTGSGGTGGASTGGLAGGASTGGGAGPIFSSGGASGSGVGVGVGVSGATSGIAGSGVAAGGSPVSSGTSGAPGQSAAGKPGAGSSEPDSGGCALVSGQSKSKHAYGAVALGLALLAFQRRRRSARR